MLPLKYPIMKKNILLFSISFFVFFSLLYPQEDRKYITHIVKEGETIKSIAKKYDCKTKEIKNLNPDADEDNLLINTTLVVLNPKLAKNNTQEKVTNNSIQPKIENNIVIHIVETGNTIFSIAKKYNIPMQSLREANKLINDNLIVGQKLRIPAQSEFMLKPIEAKVEFYQVKKGDTKWRIATFYNIKVEELEALNPEVKGDLIENQYIWVPANNVEVSDEIKDTFQQEQDKNFIYHLVKEGEGIFRIAVIYSVTEEEIEKLNPEAVKLLRPGMLLKIPGEKKDKFVTHVIEKGDTFFNLSKKYKVSEEFLMLNNPKLKDGLKIGTTIFVKLKNEDKSVLNNYNFEKGKSLKVSFLMPMMSDSTYNFGKNTVDSKLRTIVADFYLGAQMAIEQLEKKGIPIDSHVYDTKNDKNIIHKLVKISEIKNSDIIIGPFFFDKAEIVAKELKDIPIISPLHSKKQELNHQTNLIKTGIDEKNTAEALAQFLVDKHKNQKIIMISDFKESNSNDAKKIEKILNINNITVQNIELTKNTKNPEILSVNKTSLINAIGKDKDSWVILLSDNISINVDIISTYGSHINENIRLFTNDQFQNYDNVNFNHLVKLKWSFPAVQFDNLKNSEIQNFEKAFREKNYSFPETFAFSGYDITLDILTRMASGDFIHSLENVKTKGLTRSFDYNKTEQFDYINKGVNLYMLNSDFEYEPAH